jgi:hypothetical protein
MSVSSSQRRVRQRTGEEQAVTMAEVANRQALTERNVLRADIMRPPLDLIFFSKIIKVNYWGYLYICVCPLYPRLVREFYGCLEVV